MSILKYYASVQLMPAILACRWWLVALVLVAVALFGRRVYCRFVCPLGIAQSLVRLFLGRRRICSRLDGVWVRGSWFVARGSWFVARGSGFVARGSGVVARGSGGVARGSGFVVRLAILAAVVVVGLLGFGWQWLDPYAIASRAACWFTAPEFDLGIALFALVPAAVVLLLAVAAGGRIWCNWVCPVGTLLALVGMKPWKGDKVKKCAGCDTCRKCFGKSKSEEVA